MNKVTIDKLNTDTAMKYEKAKEIAEKLNADTEDDYSYKVNHYTGIDGMCYIDVFDENGQFMGRL